MSLILKTIDCKYLVQQLLYPQVRVTKDDNPWTAKNKRKLQKAPSRIIRNKRRCTEAKLLNNFGLGDWWVTLTYKDAKLPDRYDKVLRDYGRMIGKLRDWEGHGIKWLRTVENKHDSGRFHIHCVISGTPECGTSKENIKRAWEQTYGFAKVKPFLPWLVPVNETGPGLASYLNKEQVEGGKHSNAQGSRGGDCRVLIPDPITETVPDNFELSVPPGCTKVWTPPVADYNPYLLQQIAWLKPEAFGGKGEIDLKL